MPAGLDDLLAGLEGDARERRRALLDELVGRGCDEEEIRTAHEQGRLELLPLEHVLRDDGSRTLEEVAEAHSVDPDALELTRKAFGLPVERGAPIYGSSVEDHARRLRVALDAGMPLEALVSINRVIGRAMASVAAASRDAMQALLDEVEPDPVVRALRAAQAAESLAPELERVLVYAYREHVREIVRSEAGATLTEKGAAAGVRHAGIAFADLVGFTALGSDLPPEEVGAIAARLEALAGDAVRPGVAVVKTIGDEVMLASSDLPALVESVLALVSAADAQEEFPRLRAGAAAGPVVRRAGDWYGSTVNLAARLTALAEPGSLAVNHVLRDSTPAEWRERGEHAIKGFAEPVPVFAAAPLNS